MPRGTSAAASAHLHRQPWSFFGVDRHTVDNALAIYDAEADIFGNWHRAVARAGELGLDGWIIRVRNWEQVKSYIASGQPLIAAIRFRDGEFPSNIMRSTAGHLIVVRGFKPNGDVICNDPAHREKGNGIVYKADELARAWFQNAGGVAYVICKGNSRHVRLPLGEFGFVALDDL
jgi:hypothetical protein